MKGVNTRAILRRAKQMGVTMEMMDKACGYKRGRVFYLLRGDVEMSLADAEKLKELLKIENHDFGYYFFGEEDIRVKVRKKLPPERRQQD